jgi:cullin 3
MYKLFSRVESTLKFILEKMQPYIESCGEKIVSDKELLQKPLEFTKQLLDLKREIDIMVEKSFGNATKF